MKKLLVIALLALPACNESSDTSTTAKTLNDSEQPSQTWSAPNSISGVEQEIRGTYFNQADHNSSITINSDFTVSGSINTTNNWYVNGHLVGEKNTTCTFTADQIQAVQYPNNPSYYLKLHMLSGQDYAADMPRNCPSINGTGYSYVQIVAFISEKCVDLNLDANTATQRYCKE